MNSQKELDLLDHILIATGNSIEAEKAFKLLLDWVIKNGEFQDHEDDGDFERWLIELRRGL